MKHAKYIYNIQDFNPEQVLAVGYTKSKLITDAMMWFDKFSCKRSDLVITVGRDLVETVENRFKDKKVPKTVMINNWIDENEIYPLDESNEKVLAFKKKYGLGGKFVIMYSGNIGLYYDLENLIKVVEKIKPGTKTADGREVVFAFVGAGSVLDKLVLYVKQHHMDAGREARLVYGLKQNCTKAEMRRAIADGTVMKYLQKVPIHKDDLFFIQAGTVHAIGAGALVAEIQENSNLTYRLYDYDRVGKDGKKRELHIDKALDVANLKSSAEPKQPLRVLKYRQGVASELLTRCKYFEVYRMIVNTERRQKVHYRADEIAFRVLLCVNGCGTISYEGGNLPFYKGDCIFVPADSEVLTIHGQAQFLDVRG